MTNEALMRKCVVDFLERFSEPNYSNYKDRQKEIEEIVSRKPDVDRILSNFSHDVETEDGVETVVISNDVICSVEREVKEHIDTRDQALSVLSEQISSEFREELDRMFQALNDYYELIEQEEIYISLDSWLTQAQQLNCETPFLVGLSKWLNAQEDISAACLEANPETHAFLIQNLLEYKNQELFEKVVQQINKKNKNKEIKETVFAIAVKMNDSYPKAIELLHSFGQLDFVDLGVFNAMGLTQFNTTARKLLDEKIDNFVKVINALQPQLKNYFNRKENEQSLIDFKEMLTNRITYHPSGIIGVYSNRSSSSPESTQLVINLLKEKIEKTWPSYLESLEVIEKVHLNKKLLMDVKPVSQPASPSPNLLNRF